MAGDNIAEIRGTHGETLRFSVGDFNDPPNFSVEVDSHFFRAHVGGVFIVGRERVLSALPTLLEGKIDAVEVEGSEDFRLQIRRAGLKFQIFVRMVRLVYFSESRRSGEQKLECSFDASGEDLELFVEAFLQALE